MIILAVDPGSEQSAWIVYSSLLAAPLGSGITDNETLIAYLRQYLLPDGRTMLETMPSGLTLVIEYTRPRGMPASAQLFETIWWAGRFAEAVSPAPVERVQRDDVKMHLLGRRAGTDSMIRAALIDRFGGISGRAAAVGTKAKPGPLYGVSKDVWAALAVAVTYADAHG